MNIYTHIRRVSKRQTRAHIIECNRLALGHLKDMVERREVLIPGEEPQPHELAQPGEPGAKPWMGLTPEGAQALMEYDNDEDD